VATASDGKGLRAGTKRADLSTVTARIVCCLLLALALGGVMAPSSRQYPAIAPGVRIGPAVVGGLTSEPARAAVEKAYAKPIRVTYGGRTWTLDPARVAVRAGVDEAVVRALQAAPGTDVPIEVESSRAAVRRLVDKLSHSIDRPARDAELAGFDKRPLITAERTGVAVRRAAAEAAIRRALAAGATAPVALPARTILPARTRAHFGRLIVIQRGANSLRLFDGRTLVRAFGVATGQSIYPTPAGSFRIVDKQANPWWYPPDSPWAQGEKPVPPGPGNPLGTRWMGIDAPGVGIHGTPNDASIGYSASHGCIRMHIPDAEWLFQHVGVGTPVLIQ
jgi:lipoprotein-anchoring transpeptidase ErfK/SrfK